MGRRRDTASYTVAYLPIILAQRELRVISDEVLSSKVELPHNNRGEEGRKDESTTQKGGLQHDCTVTVGAI